MIGFYVLGGGFGHLTRVSTFIKTYKIKPPFKIITNNPNATRFFKEEEILFLKRGEIESKEILQKSIIKILNNYSFTDFYIDVFPTGILGELSASLFSNTKIHLLARRLKWKSYLPYLNQEPIHFNTVFAFEPLEEKHQKYIDIYTDEFIQTKLNYSANSNTEVEKRVEEIKSPVWLIVHSSNQEELELLWQHAQDIALVNQIEPQWIVLSDQTLLLPESIWQLQNENPADWFSHADKIFSAAGFNTIQQLIPYALKCEILPFQRRYDDQFWRAKWFKENITSLEK